MPSAPLLPNTTWTAPVSPFPLRDLPPKVRTVIRRLRTPQQVQRWIHSLHYNHRETMRGLRGVVRTNSAHCLEAVLAAATILEYRGYPPLILDLGSADLLDHTLFLFRQRGKYGAVGMSRDVGLFGRRAVYPNLRSLVQSYAAPYIDLKASLTRYGVLDLRTLKNPTWRTANTNAWFVERALERVRHRRFRLPKGYVQYWRGRYLAFKKRHPNEQPNFYPGQGAWM